MSKQILIIGKPHSTKTTFLAQFYTKLVSKKSCLTLISPVENIMAIKDASDLLANGEETKPSPTNRNVGLTMTIGKDGEQFELFCPDYGGEQINHIIDNREVNESWQSAITESNNWVFFIRPTNLITSHDLSNKTIHPASLGNGNGQEEEFVISDQSAFIELLQILLHHKGNNLHLKNDKVKLTIALTCWDEIEKKEEQETPREKLKQFLPLLLNFVESNWAPDKINIVGLSAQGFRLNTLENQEKYQTEGSENFGYLIKSDGSTSNDITELISEAL